MPTSEAKIMKNFRKIILNGDKSVVEKFDRIMSIPNTLNYYEDGVFKYGLAVTKEYVSFHSMVMYAYPELQVELKQKLKKVKFRKGCINFKNLDDFPIKEFENHIKLSSELDFTGIIKHHKSKNQ